MLEGVDGLLRDKTRRSGKPPLATTVIERVVALTGSDPHGEATHWTAAAMPRRTTNQSPLSGPPIPTKLSLPSIEGGKC